MSAETSAWLNTMTLIGFTSKRGNAWHYRAEDQGAESNHYELAVPQDDVLRRLFNFEVVEAPIFVPNAQGGYDDIPGRKAMVTSDTNEVLGIFKDGYQGHSYQQWLIDNVANILDDTLSIGSAGLLKNRAQAWVSVEVPDTIVTPEGVEFRPNLVACTSFDGSLATTYKRTVTNVVCDNTLQIGLMGNDQKFKLKHTKYSHLKLEDARQALEIVYGIADDFAAEVKRLCEVDVTDKQFGAVMDIIAPLPEDEGRGRTVAEKKRAELITLWHADERVTPWKNTAWGIVQAFNTWDHHKRGVRKGLHRGQKNMAAALDGTTAASDAATLQALSDVLRAEGGQARELVLA